MCIRDSISAVCWGNQRNMSHQDHKGEFGLMGYSPDMQQIAPQQILMGRYLNEVDELRQRKVCVIGLQVWRDLFPGGEDPTGKTIQIGSSYFTVVGVTKPLGGMMAFSDPERTVVIPALLVQQMYGLGRTIDMLALTGYADEPTQEAVSYTHLRRACLRVADEPRGAVRPARPAPPRLRAGLRPEINPALQLRVAVKSSRSCTPEQRIRYGLRERPFTPDEEKEPNKFGSFK